MSVHLDDAARRAAYWPLAVVRALPVAIVALVITFTANHSAFLGLVNFGIFALVSGILMAILSWLRLRESGVQPFLLSQGVLTAVSGIAALLLRDGGIVAFLASVTVFAFITGFLELYCGLRTRRRFVAAGDWRFGGVLTILMGVALVLVPPQLRQSVSTPEGTTGILDASVVAVGIFGAYGAILAIYLLIAGFSAKWGTQASPVTPAVENHMKGGTPT